MVFGPLFILGPFALRYISSRSRSSSSSPPDAESGPLLPHRTGRHRSERPATHLWESYRSSYSYRSRTNTNRSTHPEGGTVTSKEGDVAGVSDLSHTLLAHTVQRLVLTIVPLDQLGGVTDHVWHCVTAPGEEVEW